MPGTPFSWKEQIYLMSLPAGAGSIAEAEPSELGRDKAEAQRYSLACVVISTPEGETKPQSLVVL